MHSNKEQIETHKKALSVELLTISDRPIITLISDNDITISSKEKPTTNSNFILKTHYSNCDDHPRDAYIDQSNGKMQSSDETHCDAISIENLIQIENKNNRGRKLWDETSVLMTSIAKERCDDDSAIRQTEDIIRDTRPSYAVTKQQIVSEEPMNNDSDNLEEGEKENEYDNGMEDIDDDDDNDDSSEQDLTNLGWLIDLKNLTTWSDNNGTYDRSGSSAEKSNGNAVIRNINFIEDIDDDDGCLGPIISDKDLSEERFNKFMSQVKQSQVNYAQREHIYRVEHTEKPPFNYAQIIAMAMMENGRMTLKEICKWIQERFAYFRYNKNWNNSIRHNLSLHFCFTKIAREKTEKGKGGYWELSMNTAKSEKKRVRNRKKHRDESGRFSVNIPRYNRNTSMNKASYKINYEQNFTDCQLSNLSNIAHVENSLNSIDTIPENEVLLLEHLPIQEDTSEFLVNNLVLFDSNQSKDEHDREQENGNNADFLIAEAIPASLDGDEHQIFVEHDMSLNDTSITVEYSTTPLMRQVLQAKMPRTANILVNDDTSNDIILYNQQNMGPNVIVEPLPYGLSHMDTVLDIEREFSSLVNMPDPELTEEGFFDYGNW